MISFFILIALLCLLSPLLGRYIARVFTSQDFPMPRSLGTLAKLCFRLSQIDPQEQMNWKQYGFCLFAFNLIGLIALIFLQLFQGYLPLNPEGFEGVHWSLAFNTAASFVTNTNWQAYAGETTMSYFTQMAGLTTQNFLSAATGMGVLLVLARGLIGQETDKLGNFWNDLVRMVIYVLLPLSILFSLLLISQGAIQTLSPHAEATTLEKNEKQVIPLGPVASQVAIKQLGTNGGGYFNANSAHPFENPTPLTNFAELFAMILIPAATVYAFGEISGKLKHAKLLLYAMAILWLLGGFMAMFSEAIPNPIIDGFTNLEGKEVRFGTDPSILWAVTTTATANGSVNAMLSSLSPLAGGIALFNILLGELLFGGIGVGLCSMIMMVLLTVFLSGLMVGRTPEYFGKKIERNEMQWVVMAVLLPGALILVGAGIFCSLTTPLESISARGPHGLTELLYAFASAAGNNGSAFAGLNANTDLYNVVLGIVMLLGRLSIVLPSLAIGALFASKKSSPSTLGTFSIESPLFLILLIATILIVAALTFFPALTLGPLVEQTLMLKGRTF